MHHSWRGRVHRLAGIFDIGNSCRGRRRGCGFTPVDVFADVMSGRVDYAKSRDGSLVRRVTSGKENRAYPQETRR